MSKNATGHRTESGCNRKQAGRTLNLGMGMGQRTQQVEQEAHSALVTYFARHHETLAIPLASLFELILPLVDFAQQPQRISNHPRIPQGKNRQRVLEVRACDRIIALLACKPAQANQGASEAPLIVQRLKQGIFLLEQPACGGVVALGGMGKAQIFKRPP
jgi:hypothetical protein